eukprot:CAMPEP_0173372168 /NCGR_PEP_ID=MMETSP1144-20121109/27714_1 /TAXON_ID=483371 /ORGANISM="non described non described, Strain CCMP2298" /LENGTH=83 /DNA_ID=CAMNT_0014324045 /DNA_START=264 /DNA_END=518 /DNA_ORIENTATION=-
MAAFSTRHSVDLPLPEGPTTTHPMRWSIDSLSWIIFFTCDASSTRRNALTGLQLAPCDVVALHAGEDVPNQSEELGGIPEGQL